jgi:hypothetical protein
MQTLAAGVEKAWSALFGGLQRGDPTTYLFLGLIVVAAALLVVRRSRG